MKYLKWHLMHYLKCGGGAGRVSAGVITAGLTLLAALLSIGAIPANRLGAGTLWDDGRAEFSQYVGVTSRYGEDRATEARIVIVKEDQLESSLVKSDQGPLAGRTREVLKIVFTADFNTGSYFYRQAATTFLDRRTLEMRKLVATHFDGCGITTVQIAPRGGRWVHHASSYWEGEGEREVSVAWPIASAPRVFWDALPLWLRGRLATAMPERVLLLPGQVSGHSPLENTRPVVAALKTSDAGEVVVPAGRFRTRRVDVTAGGRTDRFWFDAAYPHVLLRLETAGGRKLALRKTQRLDYWKHHAEGDERLVR